MSTNKNDHAICKEWDVFIAYHGDEVTGTQRRAEVLYDYLQGYRLNNGHTLRVYQHTKCNPDGKFGVTPEIVMKSKVFLLMANKNIPVEPTGELLRKDGAGQLKRLYEEVSIFAQSPQYRSKPDEAVCYVIMCDGLDYSAAEKLYYIFAGRLCRKWSDEFSQDFKPLLRSISKILTGSDMLEDDYKDVPNMLSPKYETTANTGISIGSGAQARLMRLPNGVCAPYECIAQMNDINRAQEANCFIEFQQPLEKKFVPDSEVFCDCEKILDNLKKSQELKEDETVFLRFINDIQNGTKDSRLVNRICGIESAVPYGKLRIQTQPIEYLWIMKMAMLDTYFQDGDVLTTLRKKYAHPIEEHENFSIASRLACHCGCGVFIITSDGYIVFQNRFSSSNNRVSFFPGKISYTVSGSYLSDSGTIFDFMNDKIDRELGNIIQDLYLWELGYEYEYLHYQFSFFSFCVETKEEFIECTRPRSGQAQSFCCYDLRDEIAIANIMEIEKWESSAWAVLANALMSNQFCRLLSKKCGIQFDRKSFINRFRASHR